MKAIIIAGAPASGKSTLAQEYVKQGYVEINRDNLRFLIVDPGGDWTTYQFNEKNEKEVQSHWYRQLLACINRGEMLVISDTNCKAKDRRRLTNKLTKAGYEVTVVVLDVALETLIERDSKRGGFSVGADVIKRKYEELHNETN